MDLHKLAHHMKEIFNDGHLHLPLFAVLFGIIRNHKPDLVEKTGCLGDMPGDNILPKNILTSIYLHSIK